MQNIMIGGYWQKMKNKDLGWKMEKGKGKKGENCIKNGIKGRILVRREENENYWNAEYISLNARLTSGSVLNSLPN